MDVTLINKRQKEIPNAIADLRIELEKSEIENIIKRGTTYYWTLPKEITIQKIQITLMKG